MNIIARFKKLNLWNKLGVFGAVCSILAFLLWLLWPIPQKYGQSQIMTDSPGGTQIAVNGDLNINTDRRLRGNISDSLVQRLKTYPCPITVGVLGVGGEPNLLAEDFLRIAKAANCPTKGIYHAVGHEPFYGIIIKFSQRDIPKNTIAVLNQSLKEAEITYINYQDSLLSEGEIYIYVGYKP